MNGWMTSRNCSPPAPSKQLECRIPSYQQRYQDYRTVIITIQIDYTTIQTRDIIEQTSKHHNWISDTTVHTCTSLYTPATVIITIQTCDSVEVIITIQASDISVQVVIITIQTSDDTSRSILLGTIR